MKTCIALIINKKEDLSDKITNIKTNFNDEKYEIILINNILNYDLTKYYKNNPDEVKIINLSKNYSFTMNTLACSELIQANTYIIIDNSYNINCKELVNYYHKVKNNELDQIINYNKTEKKLFDKEKTDIGLWIFNSSVKNALIKLYQMNIKIDFNEIGFNTLKNIDNKINIKEEECDNYYLIKDKIGFDNSLL